MITSHDNEKLKLVRKLRERKHREREGLFATEGEDLLEAGLAAGASRSTCSPPPARDLGGEEVEPELLDAVSTLGSGTRVIAVWPLRWRRPGRRPCIYLHGVGDPGNVGTIMRTAHALLGGAVVARARLRRPLFAEGGAGEHGLDLRAAAGRGRVGETPAPRVGAGRPRRGRPREALGAAARRRSASAPSARGCRRGRSRPARRRRRSRSAPAPSRSTSPRRRRSALERISSLAAAGGDEPMLERIEEIRSEARRRSGRAGDARSSRSCGSATSAAKPS